MFGSLGCPLAMGVFATSGPCARSKATARCIGQADRDRHPCSPLVRGPSAAARLGCCTLAEHSPSRCRGRSRAR
eukprot:4106785-Prymnesium_polylepis.1